MMVRAVIILLGVIMVVGVVVVCMMNGRAEKSVTDGPTE